MGALENAQYERFAREYVVDYNGTQAVIRAGYSEKSAASQASRLLRNDKVLARVRELQHEQAERLCISADWVVLKLVDVTHKAMQAEPVMKYNFATKEMEETGEYLFDSKGANRALELIGKHIGMFDKREIKDVEDLQPLAEALK